MGIYKREREAELRAAGVDPVAGPGADHPANDLDIEKKWLQLVKIDKEQFSYFFDKYHDRIFKYVYLRISDHDRAGELTGEIFTLAWRRSGRFSWQGYSFGAWLFQLARWVIGHECQWEKARGEIEFDPDLHGRVTEDNPETECMGRQEQELVRKCVARLPAMLQDMFVLYYWMDMTRAQVALIMKMPEGTVSSHLHRGRKMLRTWLRECGVEGGLSPQTSRVMDAQALKDSGLKMIDRKAKA